jgi:hypothetical protein
MVSIPQPKILPLIRKVLAKTHKVGRNQQKRKQQLIPHFGIGGGGLNKKFKSNAYAMNRRFKECLKS